MNACCSFDSSQGKVSPELGEIKNEKVDDDNILKRNRRPTDIFFLIAFALFFVVLFGLLGYCIHFGDIHRILNGFDNCGNVCGRNNTFNAIDGTPCHGIDMTKNTYLRVHSWNINEAEGDIKINRNCVDSCSSDLGFQRILNLCLPASTTKTTNSYVSKAGLRDFFQEVAKDLYGSWLEILYMCLVAFVFSIITLVMFRYLAGVIVWIVLVGVIMAFVTATTLLWIHYGAEVRENPSDDIGRRRVNMFLVLAIISTIITVVLLISTVFLRKRIKMVIVLFKEAGKAAASMPLLLFEPILTFITLSITIALWLYFTLWIESSGQLKIQNETAVFVKDDTMKVTRWYNLMALFWTMQFLIGCQHMVIAGAVAIWYFTRNKNNLNAPISTSFKNLIQFHLGTVALGSLLIAAIQMIRVLLRVSKKKSTERPPCAISTCECCLGSCQNYLQYINRNAYIETAIYGDPFFTAGSKAFHKLMSNPLRVFTINTLGDFVLFLGKVFVIMITVLFGMELLRSKSGLHHMWVLLTLAGIFAFLISHCFITVYEMIIDTIFLCFCEDCEMNDGISRPHYMSKGLMKFVTDSKELLGINDAS